MVDQDRSRTTGFQGSEAMQAAEAAGEDYGKVKGRTQREIVWRRFRRHRLAMIGGLVLVLLYAAALATPWIAPYGYADIDYTALDQGPSLKHPMGTDELGRDELTRVIYGGRVSLLLGLGVGVFSTIIGAVIGIISGYYGRFVDTASMGFTDFMLTLPFLPIVLGVMLVQATLITAEAILIESALSFLGLGIQPPTPSWGNLLEDARTTMTTQWWLTWFPGMMIVVTVLCVNFLGDGLRDALDPKAVE